METDFYFNNKRIPVIISGIDNPSDNFMTLAFSFNRPLIDEIKASTEARQFDFKHKVWKLKKTDRNFFVLAYLMGEKPYERYDIPLETAIAVDSDLIIDLNNLDFFWDHQLTMYSAMAVRKQMIIAGEPRTGKTLPVLELMRRTQNEDAWWVAPKSAIRGFKRELKKWEFPYNIYPLTYDKFRNIYNGSPELVPRFCVFDECQKLKNPRSKQGQKAKDLASKQKAKYGEDRWMIELSGTPAPKDPSDWWNICEVACPGYLREGSHMALKQRLGNYEQREGQVGQKYWHRLNWKKDEVEFLHKRLGGLVEVFLKKDCLDLPAKLPPVLIDLPISDMYRKSAGMLRDSIVMAATLRNKLCQLSDGFQYTHTPNEETGKRDRKIHYFPNCPKDDQLRLDLDEFEDVGRFIVYCGFQATVDKIVRIGLQKDWTVLKVDGRGWEAFNTLLSVDQLLIEMDRSTMTDRVPKLLFAAQSDSASTGLELSASPVAAYFSNSSNGASRMQSEERPYSNNMDKERGYEVRDYLHLPVDRLVYDNLKTKKDLQMITMGELVECMKGVWE